MEYQDIVNLIKLVKKNGLAELRMQDGEFSLTIRTDKYRKSGSGGSAVPVSAPPAVMTQTPIPAQSVEPASTETEEKAPSKEESYEEIKSPMVGTFYRSPNPDKPPFIQIGDVIEKGQVVCIVEAMKLFNEIESEISGKIVKVLVDDASPIEFDQPLFLIDPKA